MDKKTGCVAARSSDSLSTLSAEQWKAAMSAGFSLAEAEAKAQLAARTVQWQASQRGEPMSPEQQQAEMVRQLNRYLAEISPNPLLPFGRPAASEPGAPSDWPSRDNNEKTLHAIIEEALAGDRAKNSETRLTAADVACYPVKQIDSEDRTMRLSRWGKAAVIGMGTAWRFIRIPVVAGVATFFVLSIILSYIVALVAPTKCRDGWHSHSIGIQGACSHHRGVDPGLGSLIILFSVGAGFGVGLWRQSVEDANAKAKQRQAELALKDDAAQRGIACPICGFPMGKRLAQRGRHRGKSFMGCSRYPVCKGARPLTPTEAEA